MTFLIGIAILGLFKILTPQEILNGFANDTIVIILMLLLLGNIIRKAAIIESAFDKLFTKSKNYIGFTAQMMVLVAAFSAFLNNTPIVAVMMPYINTWSKKHKVPISKLLLPLSYAAILGGAATLIGTSTNLIVGGLIKNNTIIKINDLEIFDFIYVGIPMIFIGIIYMIFIGSKILPSTHGPDDNLTSNRDYILEAEIRNGSHLIGKTVEEAELRNLERLYLVKITRNSQILSPIKPETILFAGDFLFFAGDTKAISDLVKPELGLTIPDVGMLIKKKHTDIVELVISHNSTLINKTAKEANFRGKYDSAIIAIHRNGEKINSKIGLVKLKAGDVLLIMAGEDLDDRSIDTKDFYFMSKVREIRKLGTLKATILLGGTALAIVLSSFKIIPLFLALLILILILSFYKIVDAKSLHKGIDYNLAIIIAMALALGTAMTNTGVARMIAHVFTNLLNDYNPIIMLISLYATTSILAAYITNIPAVSIVLPISLTIAQGYIEQGIIDTAMPLILVVSFAAAANFITPIGYQTNIMVYGPGGYSFKDFFKVGVPLTFIYMVVTIGILYNMYF